MKKKICLLIFFCVISSGFSRQKITLAVMDLEAKNVEESYAGAMTDLLRTELFNSGRFQIAERQHMSQIIEEINFQHSGLTETEKAIEIGKMLNVKMLIMGTLSKFGDSYFITIRMVDVKTGLLSAAEKAKTDEGNEESLPTAIKQIAAELASKNEVEGHIIKVNEDDVIFDLGKLDAMVRGMALQVIRPGEIVTDLEGRVIGSHDQLIGVIIINSVQDKFSIGTVQNSSFPIAKGDRVKLLAFDPGQNRNDNNSSEAKSQSNDENDPSTPAIF